MPVLALIPCAVRVPLRKGRTPLNSEIKTGADTSRIVDAVREALTRRFPVFVEG